MRDADLFRTMIVDGSCGDKASLDAAVPIAERLLSDASDLFERTAGEMNAALRFWSNVESESHECMIAILRNACCDYTRLLAADPSEETKSQVIDAAIRPFFRTVFGEDSEVDFEDVLEEASKDEGEAIVETLSEMWMLDMGISPHVNCRMALYAAADVILAYLFAEYASAIFGDKLGEFDESGKIPFPTGDIKKVLLAGAKSEYDALKKDFSGVDGIQKLKDHLARLSGIQCESFSDRQRSIAGWFGESADASIKRRLLDEVITASVFSSL